ncbi:LAME_0F08372g1_1 [Lachancea meyersii CBS 8951]|uniref:LAME_0F08372g1_1 n=1 Tax=Lachancea meyersii CBS 8951 TaxID=1266667 RepID=A0A1G4JUQ3_9SACH|nr:LAME_0F08372g1_1 [Lachancea meyersii CBS 8951]
MPSLPGEDSLYDQYGVVIDAGSSGSRLYVYKWQDPQFTAGQANNELQHSVPQIHLEKEWTSKTSPGLSSFASKPKKAFSEHIKPLLEFAESIVPREKLQSTPVFLQATAGMRLLPEAKRNAILENVCHGMKQLSSFSVDNCESRIQVIDGETEGLYGWIGLNYLLGNLNDFQTTDSNHQSFGFMDMGGASAQIAFVPSNESEIEKHDDDISTITLRSVNGEAQSWRVFVSTWLGFGANQARSRYLAQMVNRLPENSNDRHDDDLSTRRLTDPCMLKGSSSNFKFKDVEFQVIGSGNYKHCAKSIFPLLMKDIPCREEPCLFNGVHAPSIDFYKDKFVGTSEFWYTANDVFQIGGEYNFYDFSLKVNEYCETNWSEIEELSKSGKFNDLSPKLLMESCFKANWILSVLHEGFEMPRVGIEVPGSEDDKKDDTEKIVAAAAAFRSTDSVNGHELSWTLGKIVLYASALVADPSEDLPVGIRPSANDIQNFNKKFIPGWATQYQSGSNSILNFSRFFSLLVMILIVAAVVSLLVGRNIHKQQSSLTKSALSLVKKLRSKLSTLKNSALSTTEPDSDLEEGLIFRPTRGSEEREGIQVRSRSMFNLEEARHIPRENFQMGNRAMAASPDLSGPERVELRAAFSLADFSNFIKSATPSKKDSN